MNTGLLQEFIDEEADENVRQLLLRRIEECRVGIATGVRKYDFNRFIVTIDCESKIATVEDDLDPRSAGKGMVTFEDFRSALWR
jgi:hypothetical protein